MRPINNDGNFWGAETSQLAFADIRQTVKRDLQRLDERRSDGRMNADNGWSPATLVVDARPVGKFGDKEAEHGVFKVDPVLAGIHHSGDESRNLFRERWAQFCRAPQDETEFHERVVVKRREATLATMLSDGKSIAAEVAAISAPETSAKRKPGPKLGSKNKPKPAEN